MRHVALVDGTLHPDVIINNVGDPESGARQLIDALYARGVPA
jgi:hypothetical protein